MFRTIPAILLTIALLWVMGCASHTHTIGYGPDPDFPRITSQRQWYLLYGLVPINEIDTQAMAEGRRNYEITTQVTLLDWIYQGFLAPATITCRTVIVKR